MNEFLCIFLNTLDRNRNDIWIPALRGLESMVLKIEIEHKLLPKTILYYNILHFLHNVGKKPDPNKIKYKNSNWIRLQDSRFVMWSNFSSKTQKFMTSKFVYFYGMQARKWLVKGILEEFFMVWIHIRLTFEKVQFRKSHTVCL